MLRPRAHAGYASHPGLGLVMVGGRDADGFHNTSESTLDGIHFVDQPGLPVAAESICVVSVDDDDHGGEPYLLAFAPGKKYFRLRADRPLDWIPIGEMPTDRTHPICGKSQDPHTKQNFILVAGGNLGKVTLDTSDRLNLDTLAWSKGPGPRLPYPVAGASSVHLRNRIYVMGGFALEGDQVKYLRNISVFEPREKAWKTSRLGRANRLLEFRSFVTGFLVDSSQFSGCFRPCKSPTLGQEDEKLESAGSTTNGALAIGGTGSQVPVLVPWSKLSCAINSSLYLPTWLADGAAAAYRGGERIIYCGGYRRDRATANHKSCFQYSTRDGEWCEQRDILKEPRKRPGRLHHPKLGFLMVGGLSHDYKSALATSVAISERGILTDLPDLPRPMAHPCLANLNDTTVVAIGDGAAYTYKIGASEWGGELPQLPKALYGMACGTVRAKNETLLVAAGGAPMDRNGSMWNSYVLNLDADNGNWTKGPFLPRTLVFANSVQRGDTFLVVWGASKRRNTFHKMSDKVYEFDADAWQWRKTPASDLHLPSYGVVLAEVNTSLVGNC